MTTPERPVVPGSPALDRDGVAVGRVERTHPDPVTGVPQWLSVRLADDGRLVLAPAHDAGTRSGATVLAHPAATVRTAPGGPATGVLPDADLLAAVRHYLGPAGPGPAASVLRSAEVLRAGTRRVVTGRVRVAKRVVTEERTVTVVVRREELVVTEEPAGTPDAAGSAAHAAGSPADDVAEVVLVLHEERPVVTTEVVAVERVVVRRQVVRGEQTVTAPVRHEAVTVEREDRTR